jgi:hypothetical protein
VLKTPTAVLYREAGLGSEDVALRALIYVLLYTSTRLTTITLCLNARRYRSYDVILELTGHSSHGLRSSGVVVHCNLSHDRSSSTHTTPLAAEAALQEA